jgi:hypothetical protein
MHETQLEGSRELGPLCGRDRGAWTEGGGREGGRRPAPGDDPKLRKEPCCLQSLQTMQKDPQPVKARPNTRSSTRETKKCTKEGGERGEKPPSPSGSARQNCGRKCARHPPRSSIIWYIVTSTIVTCGAYPLCVRPGARMRKTSLCPPYGNELAPRASRSAYLFIYDTFIQSIFEKAKRHEHMARGHDAKGGREERGKGVHA